jgi:hypothetical protein
MYVIYSQDWTNGKTSLHRRPEDIGEFALTHGLQRQGLHKTIKSDIKTITSMEGKLGKWK